MADQEDKKKKKKVMVKKPKVDGMELTKLYSDKKKIVQEKVKTLASENGIVKDKVQGINIDKAESKAIPRVFVRKVVSVGGERGTTKIVSDDGKGVIYEGRSNDQKTKDAVKANERHVRITNEQRDENAKSFNTNYGNEPIVDEKEKLRLLNTKKAVSK